MAAGRVAFPYNPGLFHSPRGRNAMLSRSSSRSQPLPEKISLLLQEARWLILGVMSLYVGLVLVGYSEADPGWSIFGLMRYRSTVLDPAMNELGRVALVVADAINSQLAKRCEKLGVQFVLDLSYAGIFGLRNLPEEPKARKLSFLSLLHPGYGKRMLFVTLFWTCSVIPVFAVYAFAPKVLGALNLKGDWASIGSVAITCLFVVGCIVGTRLLNTNSNFFC